MSAETLEAPQTAETPRSIRIIVADDSRANVLVLKAMLKQFGFTPEVARNGLEAVKLTEAELPTLILMDINMPVMNGIDATLHIRRKHADVRIPIIAVTACSESRHLEEYKLAEFDELIIKPVNLVSLHRILEEYVSGPVKD